MTAPLPSLDVPDRPPITGLVFRRFAGEADVPGIVEVINAENRADAFDYVETVEHLSVELRHLPNADPARDVLLAILDGRIVGASWTCWTTRDGAFSYEHTGAVHPEVRRRGIGRAMLRSNERHLRAIATGHPDDRPRWLAAWAPDEAVGCQRLLTIEGYEPIRYFFEMIRPTLDAIPEAPLPAGLEVRPVRPEDHRRIFDADAEAFQDHWGVPDPTDADYARTFEDPDLDTSLWRVAWDGDEVAGVETNVIFAVENEALGVRRGWLERVSVRRPWRRRGLARALLALGMEALRDRGMSTAALGVDADNPNGALGLYEGLGFAVVRRATAFRKPLGDGSGDDIR